MGRKTSNKRKLLFSNNSNATHHKRRKIETPIFQKINTTVPVSSNMSLQKQINRNKSKSPNKNQNITLQEQVNSEQDTSNGNMNFKQDDKDKLFGIQSVEIETDISEDEINDSNSEGMDADDEAESSDSDEAKSDEDEKIDSDKKMDEADGNNYELKISDDKKMQVEEENNNLPFNNFDDNAYKTKHEYMKFNKLSVFVMGLKSGLTIQGIFSGCNIRWIKKMKDPKTKKFDRNAYVFFEDEESVQKALLKHETEYNGSVIKVYRKHCCVFVGGIKENTKLEKIFTGCKIHSVDLKKSKRTNKLVGAAVSFKDHSSFEKAQSIKAPPGIRIEKMYKNKPRNRQLINQTGILIDKMPFKQRIWNQVALEEQQILLLELKA